MSNRKNDQVHWPAWALLGAFTLGFFVVYGPVLARPVSNDPTQTVIHESAVGMFVLWVAATPLLAVLRTGSSGNASTRTIARVLYTAGCLAALLHVAIVFHVGHGWSHRAAYEHTKRVGGFGPGIFVNYFFLLLWVVEVVWVWLAFDHYLRRPRWLNLAIVGFMWFLFLNAVVVFGAGASRWIGLVFLTAPWVGLWSRPAVHASHGVQR